MSTNKHPEQYKAPWANDDAKPWQPPQGSQQSQSDQQSQEEGKEESLTTLLDEDQRGELTLLIASAMVAMRRTITSSFDANVLHHLPYQETR